MSLFSYYQFSSKSFPCGIEGFLEPRFKREWVQAIGRNNFDLTNEQNIRTWQREWPTLSDEQKKAAMRNLMQLIGRRKVNNSLEELSADRFALLKIVESYLLAYSDKDTLAWVTAFMSSDLSERKGQDHEIPTLTFAAHLLDWTRLNRPSVLKNCVAMLESWKPFTYAALYKSDDQFPGALERLSAVLPNTALERTSAIACAVSGQDALLSGLLSRPETDTAALLKHAQSMLYHDAVFEMLSALNIEGKSAVFMANARSLGQKVLVLYKKQETLDEQKNPDKHLFKERLHQHFDFLKKLVSLGVECGDESIKLLMNQGSNLSIERYFNTLSELSQPWSKKQHNSIKADWDKHGGIFHSEDMFDTIDENRAVLTALSRLPDAWTQWFEDEYRNEMKKAGSGLLNPQRNGISIDSHRWFYTHTPKIYEHWIQGLAPNIELLTDPVVGKSVWLHTQARATNFLFQATLDWIKAPEMNYDFQHAAYPLVKLAWARRGVDLEASLTEAMKDMQSDYRSVAMEAISPGKGKHRWQALMCVIDVFKEKDKDKTLTHWTDQPLVQEVIRTCIAERLDPTSTVDMHIDNAPALFS